MHTVKTFTSLRGLACLLVVMTHVWTIFDLPRLLAGSTLAPLSAFLAHTFNGSAAVEIFFVLSGCVLAMSLEKTTAAGTPAWVQQFYIRRVFRIYPALWASIALTLCLWPLITAGFSSGVYSDWALTDYPSHVTPKLIALSLAAVYVHLNGPTWTLRVELFYSLLFPFIFLCVRHPSRRLPLLAALALLAVLPIPRAWSVHYALAFGLGAAIPFSRATPRLTARWIVPALLLAVVYLRSLLELGGMSTKYIEDIEILLSAAVIYCLYHNRSALPMLERGAFVYLGDISYSIYILHFPLVFACATLVVRKLGTAALIQAPLVATLSVGISTLVLTFIVAALGRRYIETPGERIGRAICKALYGGRRDRPATARLAKET